MRHSNRQHTDSPVQEDRPPDPAVGPTPAKQTVASELADVEREVAELVEANERLADTVAEALGGGEPAAAPASPVTGYLVFVPAPGGYQLHERTGMPPALGDVVALEAGDERRTFVVVKVAGSPLPDDARPCCYLMPAPAAAGTRRA